MPDSSMGRSATWACRAFGCRWEFLRNPWRVVCTRCGRRHPWDSGKPSIPEVIDRFRAYHDQHPTWGSLHIVLDDLNVADYHVEFCVQWALDNNDAEGAELARILRRMSRTQRSKLAREA